MLLHFTISTFNQLSKQISLQKLSLADCKLYNGNNQTQQRSLTDHEFVIIFRTERLNCEFVTLEMQLNQTMHCFFSLDFT